MNTIYSRCSSISPFLSFFFNGFYCDVEFLYTCNLISYFLPHTFHPWHFRCSIIFIPYVSPKFDKFLPSSVFGLMGGVDPMTRMLKEHKECWIDKLSYKKVKFQKLIIIIIIAVVIIIIIIIIIVVIIVIIWLEAIAHHTVFLSYPINETIVSTSIFINKFS